MKHRKVAPAVATRLGIVRVAALVAASSAFFGCRTPPSPDARSLGWEEHRFSNQPRPYDALLVEIDAVEGTGPTAYELSELEAFLKRGTNKPGGIRIKVDNIIPRHGAEERGPDALALEYLNGPGDERTAFLYVLCYRSRLTRLFVKPDHPQFTYFPHPCSVFIDRSYQLPLFGLFYRPQFRRAILLHEIGHALGLANNPAHSKRGHCTSENCLMRERLVFRGRRFFTFRQPWENTMLCASCEQDLESYKTRDPKPNERLWQGYFVHEKPGYQFVTLPGFVYVHIGDAADITMEEVTDAREAAMVKMRTGTTFTATTNDLDPSRHAAALGLLAQEDNESIRELARNIFERSVEISESLLAAEPEKAAAFVSEELILAAATFPELQTRLKAVREKVGAQIGSRALPAGSGVPRASGVP